MFTCPWRISLPPIFLFWFIWLGIKKILLKFKLSLSGCIVVQLPSHVWLWHHGLQHTRRPCPSPSPEAWPSSCPIQVHASMNPVMLSNHLILWCPLLLPSIFPSIRDFSSEVAILISWAKYWSFSISPSNEYSWLISLKIDWFDLLAVNWT